MAVHKATFIALFLVAVFSPPVIAMDGVQAASVTVDGCSGTVIARGKVWAYGISAAHCVDEDGPVAIRFMNGTRCKGTWESVDLGVDLALFRFSAKHLVAVIDLNPRRVSDGIRAYGLNGLKKLKYSETGLIHDKSSRTKYLRAEYKVESGKFDNGDSGGGVFVNGKMCGVITHGKDEKLYAATHGQILTFLAEQKALKYKITTEDSEEWGDEERTKEIVALKKQLKALADQVKSLEMKAGLPGKDGVDGRPGPRGEPGTSPNLNPLEQRLSTVEGWIRNFKAVVRVRLVPKGE